MKSIELVSDESGGDGHTHQFLNKEFARVGQIDFGEVSVIFTRFTFINIFFSVTGGDKITFVTFIDRVFVRYIH